MKRAIVLLVAGAFFFSPVSARCQAADSATSAVRPIQRDSFLGLDKPKHFALSFFIQSASFAALQAAGANRRPAMTGATVLTASFGVGREVHDRKTKGLFSFGDLAWDALGYGTAVLMLRHTYR